MANLPFDVLLFKDSHSLAVSCQFTCSYRKSHVDWELLYCSNSTYLVQFATISRNQIYLGKFLKFTGMLSILERKLLQCIFSFSK